MSGNATFGQADKMQADFLLVADQGTATTTIEALETFVRTETSLGVDTWNIATKGPLPNLETDRRNMGPLYPGKTIVFLVNDFRRYAYADAVLTKPARLVLRDHILHHGTCLFLDCDDFPAYEACVRDVLQQQQLTPRQTVSATPAEDILYDFDALHHKLRMARQADSLWFSRIVVCRASRHKGSKELARAREVQKDRRALRLCLPQERLTMRVSGTVEHGHFVVTSELPHRIPLAAVRPPASAGPDLLSRYMLIASLPLRRRAELLWSGDACSWSRFAQECLVLSTCEAFHQEWERLVWALSHNQELLPSPPEISFMQPVIFSPLIKLHLPVLDGVLEAGRPLLRADAPSRTRLAKQLLRAVMDIAASRELVRWWKRRTVRRQQVRELVWKGIEAIVPYAWGFSNKNECRADRHLTIEVARLTRQSRESLATARRDWNDVDPDKDVSGKSLTL